MLSVLRTIGLWVFVPVGAAGALLGILGVTRGIRSACPMCGEPASWVGPAKHVLAVDCEKCGLVGGNPFLNWKGQGAAGVRPTDDTMTTTSATTPAKPRRRWLQFSLRTLMVLMLVCGCVLGWLAREVQRVRAQREAVKAIRELGAVVGGEPPGGLVGEEPYPSGDMVVTEVFLGGTRISDAGLAHLRKLPRLQRLHVDNTQVTDVGLVHLQGMTQLKWLHLRKTKVTDAGVNEIQQALPNVWIER